mgnify:CR=1 FL=1
MDTLKQENQKLIESLKVLEKAFLDLPIDSEEERVEVESCVNKIRKIVKEETHKLEANYSSL